ncbi:type I-B CRISPR-associated endonuclease Cas1 [Candidatus Bipolaricaulota bacterium]|nr:type I-B CRISPR-associated endonuclease Cas1 [Candidatus Bipolaricaulota bacterium]
MTRKNYYILTDGILKRKENTLYFINKDGKRPLPIHGIYSIYAYSALSISSQVVILLSKEGIPIHFFNKYGFYTGSFYPRETLLSGDLVIKQAKHFIDNEKRLKLAASFVEGAISNMNRILSYYNLDNNMDALLQDLGSCDKITEIMNVEGRARAEYYRLLDKVLPESFRIGERTRRPPQNMANALLSFGNSLLYSTIISEIYNTQLNPTISYLHEPFERRYSLALDISELFKPIIVDRLILYMIKKNIINSGDFERDLNYSLLNENGKRKFITEYDKRLKKTIKHRKIGRKVSYKRLIRLECYKLIKHLLGKEQYKPFISWW